MAAKDKTYTISKVLEGCGLGLTAPREKVDEHYFNQYWYHIYKRCFDIERPIRFDMPLNKIINQTPERQIHSWVSHPDEVL